MNPQLQQQRSGQPQEGQQVPPSSAQSYSVAHRCPSCGAAMRPHEVFCLNCGARVPPVPQPPVQNPYTEARTQQAAEPTQFVTPSGGQGTPSLEIQSTLHGGKLTYNLTKPVTNIGRDPSNEIVIDAPVVSHFHAQIVREGNQLILVHPHPSQSHTTNGLLYQGRHILGNEPFRKPLVQGDSFRIGNEHGALVTLTYHDGSEAPPYPPSTSRLQASILLYAVVIGAIGCIGGIALNRFGKLPTGVTNIAAAVSAFVSFIAGTWTVVAKLFPTDVWRNARKLPVVAACLVTVGMLLIPTLYLAKRTDPYIYQGLLVLDDPLTGYTISSDWFNFQDKTGGVCNFKDGAYHVSQALNKQFSGRICVAQTRNFHNFVIDLYVNNQLIAPVVDSTLSVGPIGVAAWGPAHSTEVGFRYAKVWEL